MKSIILLVGDSGSGKDYVLEIANTYDGLEAVKRYISREKRDGEENSISSIFSTPIDEIKKMDYYYEGAENGKWYGIKKETLEEVLNRGKTPMVICTNFENFNQMINDFPDTQIVPFFIYRGNEDSNINQWIESLRKRGSSEEEIQNRINKRDKYFKQLYVEHTDIYASNVILNLYGITSENDIRLQIEGLCQKNEIDINQNHMKM